MNPISSSPALDALLKALSEGTTSGAIRWKAADARKRTYIAERESGSVTLNGDFGPLTASGSVTLAVRDSQGRVVDQVTGTIPSGLAGAMMVSSTERNLQQVYRAVQEQVTRADSQIRKLTDEFKT